MKYNELLWELTYWFEVPTNCRFRLSKDTVTNIKLFINQTQPNFLIFEIQLIKTNKNSSKI